MPAVGMVVKVEEVVVEVELEVEGPENNRQGPRN